MRFLTIAAVIPALVSLGILVIVFGQQQVSPILYKMTADLESQADKLDADLSANGALKGTVMNLVTEGKKVMQELESTLGKMGQVFDQKKRETEVCVEEKTTKNNKLAELQKEKDDAEGQFKKESEERSKEIQSLKDEIATRSKICDYVQKNTTALTLCGTK